MTWRILPILFFALTASAADRITLTITVTNVPVTSNTLVVNASTRTWTNANSSSTIQTNLVGKNEATTNLYNQIASYPYSGPLILRWANTNQIQLIGTLGGALSASASGAWATLSLATQSGPQTYTALWPIENIVGATNRTNQASALVSGISQFSTNAFATNASATSNFITKGASPEQSVISPLFVSGQLKASGSVALTNGFTSSLTNINPVSSNLVNYGNAIRSEGIGGNSLQIGSNAVAAGLRSTAIGNGAYATNNEAIAIGYNSIATNKAVALGTGAKSDTGVSVGNGAASLYPNGVSIGTSSLISGGDSVAIGSGAGAATNSVAIGKSVVGDAPNSVVIGTFAGTDPSAIKSIAIGYLAAATHSNSVALGAGAATTTTNEIVLGTSSDAVHVPGRIEGAVSTNSTLRGTNIINGRVDFTSRANTALANGNNAGVVLGTNVFVRLSGPSAAYTLNGFASEQDGSFHILELDNPAISITVANDSGTDPTAANRIITGTGGNLTLTNNPAFLQVIYNSTASRWRVVTFSR